MVSPYNNRYNPIFPGQIRKSDSTPLLSFGPTSSNHRAQRMESMEDNCHESFFDFFANSPDSGPTEVPSDIGLPGLVPVDESDQCLAPVNNEKSTSPVPNGKRPSLRDDSIWSSPLLKPVCQRLRGSKWQSLLSQIEDVNKVTLPNSRRLTSETLP